MKLEKNQVGRKNPLLLLKEEPLDKKKQNKKQGNGSSGRGEGKGSDFFSKGVA